MFSNSFILILLNINDKYVNKEYDVLNDKYVNKEYDVFLNVN